MISSTTASSPASERVECRPCLRRHCRHGRPARRRARHPLRRRPHPQPRPHPRARGLRNLRSQQLLNALRLLRRLGRATVADLSILATRAVKSSCVQVPGSELVRRGPVVPCLSRFLIPVARRLWQPYQMLSLRFRSLSCHCPAAAAFRNHEHTWLLVQGRHGRRSPQPRRRDARCE